MFKLALKAAILIFGTMKIYEITKYLYNKITNNKVYRKDILDMMKDTPLIYIKSLSEITGCDIYVNVF